MSFSFSSLGMAVGRFTSHYVDFLNGVSVLLVSLWVLSSLSGMMVPQLVFIYILFVLQKLVQIQRTHVPCLHCPVPIQLIPQERSMCL